MTDESGLGGDGDLIDDVDPSDALGDIDVMEDPEAYQFAIQQGAMEGIDAFREALLETHATFERLYEFNREKMRRRDTSANSRNPTAASTMPTERAAVGSGVKHATVPSPSGSRRHPAGRGFTDSASNASARNGETTMTDPPPRPTRTRRTVRRTTDLPSNDEANHEQRGSDVLVASPTRRSSASQPSAEVVGVVDDFQPSRQKTDLAEVVEMLLDKGIVINADIAVSIGDTQLLGVQVRAAIASFETAAKYGLEFPEGTDMRRVAAAVDEPELAETERPRPPIDATRA